MEKHDNISAVVEIVAAYASNNIISAGDLPDLIRSVYSALQVTNGGALTATPRQEPKVSVKRSVFPDYLICLEDGKKLKTMKRHLWQKFDLTPDQYRAKWGLRKDYPMVAPNYSKQRSELAKEIGLGKVMMETEADRAYHPGSSIDA